jgi:hypothetical protein
MATVLPSGQSLFKGKDTGLIFYPSLPQKLQGTKEAGRPDFDLTWPYDYPQWVKNMHSEHATVEVRYDEASLPILSELSGIRRDQFITEMHGDNGDRLDRAAEKLRAKLPPPSSVIWWGGTVHDGIWMGDNSTYWMGGCWRDGIVLGGHFMNCMWVNGEKRGGDFLSGIWHNGIHRGGKFRGLWMGGVWMGGDFDGFRERTTEPPSRIDGNGCAF